MMHPMACWSVTYSSTPVVHHVEREDGQANTTIGEINVGIPKVKRIDLVGAESECLSIFWLAKVCFSCTRGGHLVGQRARDNMAHVIDNPMPVLRRTRS